jgi:hypothetical protein
MSVTAINERPADGGAAACDGRRRGTCRASVAGLRAAVATGAPRRRRPRAWSGDG